MNGRKLLILGLALGLSAAVPAGAGQVAKQTETVHRFGDQSLVAGAEATLTRLDNGVYMTVDTRDLEPGHAVTAWFVLFNKPENCSGGECGDDDIFNLDANGNFVENADGSPPMNMDAIESAAISLHRADGLVIDSDGTGEFRGHLPIGDATEAVFGPGLIDPAKAEIHAVIRTHQEAIPGKTNEMINSMNGGCAEAWPNEPCEDLQFAVFKPAGRV